MKDMVKLYTLSTCGHCKAVKEFLKENHISYEYTDVDLLEGEDRMKALEEVRAINPNCSFPTIIIGEKVIVGNKQDEIRNLLKI